MWVTYPDQRLVKKPISRIIKIKSGYLLLTGN